jgi:hypothetical protein
MGSPGPSVGCWDWSGQGCSSAGLPSSGSSSARRTARSAAGRGARKGSRPPGSRLASWRRSAGADTGTVLDPRRRGMLCQTGALRNDELQRAPVDRGPFRERNSASLLNVGSSRCHRFRLSAATSILCSNRVQLGRAHTRPRCRRATTSPQGQQWNRRSARWRPEWGDFTVSAVVSRTPDSEARAEPGAACWRSAEASRPTLVARRARLGGEG